MSETVTWSDPCDTVTTTSGNVVVEAACPSVTTALPVTGMVPLSGKYSSGQMTGAAMLAVSILTPNAYFHPWMKTYDTVTSAVGLSVTITAAGSARLAIYAASATTGAPIGLPVWQSADISIATVGMREEAVTYTLNRYTQYWLAVMTNVTSAARGWQVADDEALSPSDPATALAMLTSIRRSVTYGTWPNLTTSPIVFADLVSASTIGVFVKHA